MDSQVHFCSIVGLSSFDLCLLVICSSQQSLVPEKLHYSICTAARVLPSSASTIAILFSDLYRTWVFELEKRLKTIQEIYYYKFRYFFQRAKTRNRSKVHALSSPVSLKYIANLERRWGKISQAAKEVLVDLREQQNLVSGGHSMKKKN